MVIGAISGLAVSWIILILLLVVWGGWQLITVIRRNQVSTLLDEQAFQAGIRKAQVVDLREKKDFDAGHILGARNIPYSTFKAYHTELRSDLPVYLYDQGKALSTRAALLLAKEGYDQIFILKSGYARWQGKTKKTKY
ncbi:rhodanese-related sulfurtransferase [Levilactobacillus namurensis DSM 19117]|uniref:Rhodanese-related sulfurtransferase n=2 Tax=Levilactobacillus namurensis TaxID=380393 RepID=A0A0R1K1P0_9LACO|nr:rhodanese-like domain-containing protein [Levilactobacillus namurensis]PTM23816.1 rhodanese-like domain-containing protein [Lactobacillus sp. PFC-70]KRK77200.1 rhodanese-related sulfurtransferase [Levilactobacillus namurensis DSM 19117]MDT7014253.1 rhodanese-like domain-containing protein [Levilactobacillus namurensis]GEO73409.1 sulfurtransferase [Levilactobacillus namurensis]HJE44731.1 rhodanese-like domain-containing protein [Levilactobacillus namurensis]